MYTNIPTMYAHTAARPDPREVAAAKLRDAARASQAAAAALALKAEEQARFDAKAKAVPSELFADDPEIKALAADLAVKTRQRPKLSLAHPEAVHQASERLKERIKQGTLEVVIAAVEDLADGDATLRRAMTLQQQVEEDTRKLDVLNSTRERMGRGFSQTAREREEQARQALDSALLDRKRQYVREHPEGASSPASEPQPTASDVIEV